MCRSSQSSDWAISRLHIEKKIQLLKNSGISLLNILLFDCNGHGNVRNTEIHLNFVRIQTEETRIADDHIHLPIRQRDKVKGEDFFLSKTKCLHVLFNTSWTHYHTHTPLIFICKFPLDFVLPCSKARRLFIRSKKVLSLQSYYCCVKTNSAVLSISHYTRTMQEPEAETNIIYCSSTYTAWSWM